MQFLTQNIENTPILSADDAHFWLVDFNQVAGELDLYEALLSEQEKARLDRFSHAQARLQYLVSHGVLRLLLSHYTGLANDQLEFEVEKYGKPFLSSSALSFNMSHSGDCALIGVTLSSQLGVDIELGREKVSLFSITERFFSVDERQWILSASSSLVKLERFYQVWVCKEAYLKAQGLGLAAGLQDFSVCSADQLLSMVRSPQTDVSWYFKCSSLRQSHGDYWFSLCADSAFINIKTYSWSE
jgi:4'-phosphopantetheinyl transferase